MYINHQTISDLIILSALLKTLALGSQQWGWPLTVQIEEKNHQLLSPIWTSYKRVEEVLLWIVLLWKLNDHIIYSPFWKFKLNNIISSWKRSFKIMFSAFSFLRLLVVKSAWGQGKSTSFPPAPRSDGFVVIQHFFLCLSRQLGELVVRLCENRARSGGDWLFADEMDENN